MQPGTEPSRATVPVAGGTDRPAPDARLGELTDAVGRDVVEAAADLDRIAKAVASQSTRLEELRQTSEGVARESESIAKGASAASAQVQRMRAQVDQSSDRVDAALAEVRALTQGVGEAGQATEGLREALSRVASVTREIDGIAAQTNLLALNASIEAARAGEAGRGFAVVASEVKQLARQSSESTRVVSETVQHLFDIVTSLTDLSGRNVARAREVEAGAMTIGELMTSIRHGVREIDGRTQSIADGNRRVDERCTELTGLLGSAADDVTRSGQALGAARDRVQSLLSTSEQLVAAVAEVDLDGSDAAIVAKAVETADAVAARFEAALEAGEITEQDLFDRDYRPIEGTNPPQHLTRFTAFTDEALPSIQEPLLESDHRIVFCAAVDDHGYLPTHNLKYSHPQGADPEWNAAHCRNRRIFDDRVGLAAGRNTKPSLVQTYRRDMGGEHVLMKDVSAPVFVRGRHWGGFRIGYRPASSG